MNLAETTADNGFGVAADRLLPVLSAKDTERFEVFSLVLGEDVYNEFVLV